MKYMGMAKMRIELTDAMRDELKNTRRQHNVNGSHTAHEFSLALGKHRAWLSQIESGRLGYIRYGDLVLIFDALFGDGSETELNQFVARHSISLDDTHDHEEHAQLKHHTMKHKYCYYCEVLNKEENPVSISEIKIGQEIYQFYIPMICCPVCGSKLKSFD